MATRILTLQPAPGRLLSLDALRGFDMFWILGVDEFLNAQRELVPNPVTNFLAAQVTHSDWAGITPYDLIFPLFVFIAGVTTVFSLDKILQTAGRGAALKRVCLRAVLLYLMGILYYVSFLPWGEVRLLGVLQRIALGYLFTGLIYIAGRWRGLIVGLVVLLLGYWALMALVPVPNAGAGYYSEGINLANYVDRHYLPLFKWDGDHDPEGLLSTLPAIASCILGALAGVLLKREGLAPQKKVFWLLGAGLACLLLGYLWGTQFPIIKKIWTSSYVLVAGGYSFLLLALFYQVVDIWKLQGWARPFVWIGSNAIGLYLAFTVLRFSEIGGFLAELVFPASPAAVGVLGSFLAACASLLLAYLLYRRGWFLRL
jgi:predicted acyltransferase